MTLDRRRIGMLHDITVDVAGWDSVGASVDLSCACMFEREMPGKTMVGGLRNLDIVLDGALSRFRTEKLFAGTEMEFLVLDKPPAAIGSGALLIIGLGDPLAWEPAVTDRAVRLAVGIAQLRCAASVAFAPSLLDSGVETTEDTPAAMLRGLDFALRRSERAATLDLVARSTLRSWTFDAGIAHLSDAEAKFRAALEDIDKLS